MSNIKYTVGVWHCPDCGAELEFGAYDMWCPEESKSVSYSRLAA